MLIYLVRRIPFILIVILGVSFLAFLLMQLSGDPAVMMLPADASHDDILRMREQMGFDDPFFVQYGRFLYNFFVHFDLGRSFSFREPAMSVVLERMPNTLLLASLSMGFAIIVGVIIGLIAANKRNSFIDYLVTWSAITISSVPAFWLGLILILVFSVNLGWFPSYGSGTPRHLVLPVLTLSAFYLALIARLTRSGLLEVLSEDYIRTARAKGLIERLVVMKHALKNALIPLVTMMGMQFGRLIGGAVVTETVFAWPGIGRLIVIAVNQRDFPLVQSALMMLALIFVFLNLVVDILYAYLDPRIKLGK